MFGGGRDALRDRWDASERDSELLRLAAGDDLGDDNGAKRFDAAAAAILHSVSNHKGVAGAGRPSSLLVYPPATLLATTGHLLLHSSLSSSYALRSWQCYA